MQDTIKYRALVLLAMVITFSGCKKLFNLPDEKNYLSTQADFTIKTFTPRLGRTYISSGAFNPNGSSTPMTFTIQNARFGDGRDATDMLTQKPTLVWTSEYSGKETSLAEIEAKRKLENHPILEMRGSGEVIFWYTGTRDFIKPKDSVLLPQDTRYFDVKISNSGGSRTIKNLIITPLVDVPYEPHDDYNDILGIPKTSVAPGKYPVRMYPSNLSGIKGFSTNQPMNDPKNPTTGLVYLYIRKFTNDPNGHRLRIKVLGKDSLPIDPVSFNETKWLDQVHGFNPAGTAPGYSQTHEYVEYNVAYPIPLVKIPTKFTTGGLYNLTGGDRAHIELTYSRTGFGNVRETGKISQDFAIYEKGDWEIVFHFKTVNPKFVSE